MIRLLSLTLLCATATHAWSQANECASSGLPGFSFTQSPAAYLAVDPLTPFAGQSLTVTVGRQSYDPVALSIQRQGSVINATLSARSIAQTPPPIPTCLSMVVGPMAAEPYTVNAYMVDAATPSIAPLLMSTRQLTVLDSRPARYRVVAVGILQGRSTVPTSMNALGDIVGYAGGSNTTPSVPFLFQDGVLGDLSPLGIGSADAINDRRQITGTTRNGHPYIYQDGIVVDLPTAGYAIGAGRSINSLGQVAGLVQDKGQQSEMWRPFVYHDGSGTVVPSPANGFVQKINDRGQMVGQTNVAAGVQHPFLYDDGQFTDLGTLGGVFGTALAINRVGTIVGSSLTVEGALFGFRYGDGTMAKLASIDSQRGSDRADAINDRDQIVGESAGRAALWQDGVVYDLNNLLEPEFSDWILMRGVAINNAGQIAVWACQRSVTTCSAGRLEPETPLPAAPPVRSVEFYNEDLDHYFMTAAPAEIQALDGGTFAGWRRTGGYFDVLPAGDSTSDPVCRFYIPPPYGDSHFFSASVSECGIVRTRLAWLIFESPDVFNVDLPDRLTGTCIRGDMPLYRLWNQRADSNHRYTVNWLARDFLISKGYVAEGYGSDPVAMCVR